MANPTRLKKSETLEIRLPYSTKLAFMARCRDEGRSASEALRGFIAKEIGGEIGDEIGERPARSHLQGRLIVGALIAAAMGAVALPSLAQPTYSAAEFARLDANHDGKITFAEFQAGARR